VACAIHYLYGKGMNTGLRRTRARMCALVQRAYHSAAHPRLPIRRYTNRRQPAAQNAILYARCTPQTSERHRREKGSAAVTSTPNITLLSYSPGKILGKSHPQSRRPHMTPKQSNYHIAANVSCLVDFRRPRRRLLAVWSLVRFAERWSLQVLANQRAGQVLQRMGR
jgi:hypothetical protein